MCFTAPVVVAVTAVSFAASRSTSHAGEFLIAARSSLSLRVLDLMADRHFLVLYCPDRCRVRSRKIY